MTSKKGRDGCRFERPFTVNLLKRRPLSIIVHLWKGGGVLSFNVAQLEKAPIGTVRDYHVDNDPLTVEGHEIKVSGDVKLTRTNRSVLVQAAVKTSLPQECCRCLGEYECPLDVKFEEEFFPELDVTSGLPIDVEDEAENFTIDQHHVLDLTEALRQYVILTQPMKPLCRTDCPGIETKEVIIS